MTSNQRLLFLALLLMTSMAGLSIAGPGDDIGGGGEDSVGDVPPGRIADLRIVAGLTTDSSITLEWTAVGADGSAAGTDGSGDAFAGGPAASYEIRYASDPIETEEAWVLATAVPNTLAPKTPGLAEQFTVTGLAPQTICHFNVRALDAGSKIGPPSNSPGGATLQDAVAPAPVGNLSVSSADSDRIVLAWTAPGNDGMVRTAKTYLLFRSDPATGELTVEVDGLPDPAAPGNAEEFTVTGLASNTTYQFVLRTADEIPNWSDPSNIATGTTLAGESTGGGAEGNTGGGCSGSASTGPILAGMLAAALRVLVRKA